MHQTKHENNLINCSNANTAIQDNYPPSLVTVIPNTIPKSLPNLPLTNSES